MVTNRNGCKRIFLNKKTLILVQVLTASFSCSCHENACLEIKCPFLISHISPTDDTANLNYLVDSKLKISHQYYTQCHLQMVITNTKLSHFFVCHMVFWLTKANLMRVLQETYRSLF